MTCSLHLVHDLLFDNQFTMAIYFAELLITNVRLWVTHHYPLTADLDLGGFPTIISNACLRLVAFDVGGFPTTKKVLMSLPEALL